MDCDGKVLGFMLTGIRRLKGQSFTGSLRQVAVDRKTWKAQHDQPIGPPLVEIPEWCGASFNNGILFQADESGDCIEVRWGMGKGEYAATADERVQALTDFSGNILGFRISGISLMGEGEKDFINVDLYPAEYHS